MIHSLSLLGVDFVLSEESDANVGMHHGSLLSPVPFAIVVDVTELADNVGCYMLTI